MRIPTIDRVIGAGGIGTGMLFLSEINKTLGRNESRLVTLSPARDYCKAHIVLYYIRALLPERVKVMPVGYVGADQAGAQLLDEMRETGMDISLVGVTRDRPTMVSICLQYPDKDGCNFTASNSACELVSQEYVESSFEKIEDHGRTMVVVLPEIKAQAGIAMLNRGKRENAFCALSVAASDMEYFKNSGAFALCDIIAINHGEAAELVGREGSAGEIAGAAYGYLKEKNPDIMLIVTSGKNGAYTGHKERLEFVPALPATVVNTTGAGDAFLGGTLSGLAMGMPFQKGRSDGYFGESMLAGAAELGAFCAGMAVECEDSIARVTREAIMQRIDNNGWRCEKWFTK